MSATKATLAAKLVKVMAAVKNVEKNGRNTFQNYDYVTERDVIEAVRENLVKENVLLLSSVEGSQREGDLTSIVVRHTFVCGDSGETLEVKSLGTGSDKQDKGAYKAYTGAMKYMLQKCFLLPVGDADPEASDENGKATGNRKPALASVASKTVAGTGDEPKADGPKKYGFAGKPKAAPAPKAEVNTEVATDDGF